MMRRLFFFACGLLLGSWCAISFAAPTAAGSQVHLNLTPSAPAGVTVSGAWDAVVPGLEDTGYGGYRSGTSGAGSGEIYRGVATRVDGVPAALEAKRGISARNLAKGALGLAKRGGPAGIIGGALVSAGLDWASDQWWKSQTPDDAPDIWPSSTAPTGNQLCESYAPGTSIVMYLSGSQWYEYRIHNPTTGNFNASGWTGINTCFNHGTPAGYPSVWRRSVSSYTPPVETVPATDQDLEDLLTDNLVDGDLSPEEALRDIIERGNAQDGVTLNGYLEPVQGSGPSSLPGSTSTSVSSGPAGQTSTTKSTEYGLEYGPGGVVTITKGETTTTTTPTGETTTDTTTSTPSPGQNQKPADEKPFCELYPDAMACQPLGTPSPVELPTGTINVPGLSYESVTAACPAPYTFTPAAGGSYEISWQPVCDGAEAVRPVVIVIGLLTAGVFVFVGMRRGQS